MEQEDYAPFIEPMNIECQIILKQNASYKLAFDLESYKYIINIPTDYNPEYIKTISPVLTVEELNVAEDGIYTWILIDTGIGTKKEIFVRKNINITEISTKHLDILKGICSNEHYPNSRHHIESLRVYFGGELSRTTNPDNKITYDINLLSGTYSFDRISSRDFSEHIEEGLSSLFKESLCVKDCGNIEVHIERTTKSFICIKKTPHEREIFEQNMLATYCQSGVKMYRFSSDQRDLWRRTLPNTKFTFETQKNMLDRSISDKTSEVYLDELKKIEEKYGPLTKHELDQLEVKPNHSIGGGRNKKRKTNHKLKSKTRKTRKTRKTQKNQK
jgi:hypothetical protein